MLHLIMQLLRVLSTSGAEGLVIVDGGNIGSVIELQDSIFLFLQVVFN